MKILIIEDDHLNRELIKILLKDKNYTFYETPKGIEGLKMVKQHNPDVIILDVMLPDMDGFNICKTIKKNPREYGNPIVLMLTAKTEAESVISGFDAGADDYLKKPFDKKEFAPRINALARRAQGFNPSIIKYYDLVLDKNNMSVEVIGEYRALSKTEFKLLEYFLINKGIVLNREKILENVWDDFYDMDINIVNVYIKKLRDKLPELKERLISIRGFGYKLES